MNDIEKVAEENERDALLQTLIKRLFPNAPDDSLLRITAAELKQVVAHLSASSGERDGVRLSWVARNGNGVRSLANGKQNLFVWGPSYPVENAGREANFRAIIDQAIAGESHE